MNKNKTKKHTFVRVTISLLLLIILFAGTIMLFPGQKLISANSLLRGVGRIFGSEPTVGESFEFEASVDNVFGQVNGMLVVGSRSEAGCYDKEGNKIASISNMISNPAISSGTKKAAIWDIGGKKISIIEASGKAGELAAQGAIISVSLNKKDWMAVTCEENGYKGSVTVYDKDLAPCYKWHSGDGYLIDADISPDSKAMTAVTLTKLGSRIVTFNLDSENEKGSYIAENQLVFDIEYLSDNRICALSESGLIVLNKDMELVAEYRFDGEYLRDYDLGGSGFAVLLLGKHKAGETGRLVTVDSYGRELASIEVEGELLSVSAEDKYLAAVYAGRTVVYTSSLKVYGDLSESTGIRTAVMCRDGTAFIISGYGAAVFEP